MITGKTSLLGILGNPLGHSLSPHMHNEAFRKNGWDALYIPLQCEQAKLSQVLNTLKDLNFLGANVTIPFKETIIPYLDELSPLSQKLGAVNTIKYHEGKLWGTSTDAEGFIKGLKIQGFSFSKKVVGILGSGGTARTLCIALPFLESIAELHLFARNQAKSQQLSLEVFEKTGFQLQVHSLEDFQSLSSRLEIVVQTTSVGMSPQIHETVVPPGWLHPHQLIYDVIYNPKKTLFLSEAEKRGCKTLNGLPMLVYQGIASVKTWFGETPPENYYFEALNKALEGT